MSGFQFDGKWQSLVTAERQVSTGGGGTTTDIRLGLRARDGMRGWGTELGPVGVTDARGLHLCLCCAVPLCQHVLLLLSLHTYTPIIQPLECHHCASMPSS